MPGATTFATSVYQRNGDADKTSVNLTRAIQLDPKGFRDYSNRGWAYGRILDLDTAIAMYSESIRTYPEDYQAGYLLVRGILHFLKREYDQAIADFNETLRLYPNRLTCVNRGCAYLEKGELEKAIADQTEAIRNDASHWQPFVNRAWACAEKGEVGKAIADSAEALRLNPGIAEAFAVRGYALEKMGEREKAKANYAQAVKMEAGNNHEAELISLFVWSSTEGRDIIPLPVYKWLSDPENRRRIQISPEQEKKLGEIRSQYQEEDAQWQNGFVRELAKLPPDQQQTEMRKAQSQHEEQKKVLRKRVEEVLTPRQLSACKKYTLCSSAAIVMAYTAAFKSVGFTPEQREKLRQIDKESIRQRERQQKQKGEQLLALLTVQQRERLRAEVQRREFEPPREIAENKVTSGSIFNGEVIRSGTLTVSGYAYLPVANSGKTAEPAEACIAFFPIYHALRRVSARKELSLTVTQQKQLAEIATKFRADQETLQQNATDQPSEYRKSKVALEADLGHQIEALLTPRQLTELKEITFRDVAPFFIQYEPLVQDKIGLSELQKAALQKISRDEKERAFNRDCETYEKLLALLTPQQQEKLREALSQDAW